MRICYRGMFPMVILMVIVMNINIGCEADDVFSGIDEESISAKTLIQIGRRLNKPMLTLIGMAMKNLHRCSGWTRWTECNVKMSSHFGIKHRRRECILETPENGKTSEVETDLGICEGGTSRMVCPNTYNLTTNGFCMKLQVTKKNYDDAEAECNEDGGHLININSDLKYTDVKAVLGVSDVRIGGRRKNLTSPWEYKYETNSGYYKWTQDFPYNDGSRFCLAIVKNKWMDISCTSNWPFLCEIPR